MYKEILKTDEIKLGDTFKVTQDNDTTILSATVIEVDDEFKIKWDDHSEDSPLSYFTFLVNNGKLILV